jgi:sporadic carbohydrate cluster 2OG-Fe(II) oxygenase
MNIKHDEIIRNTLKRRSRIQNIDESGVIILNYDPEQYPFLRFLTSLLIENDFMMNDTSLEKLHTNLQQKDMDVDLYGFNKITASTYASSEELKSLYKQFMSEVIIPLIGQDSYIQKTPTNRFSFPFANGVNERFYHNDLMLGHPPEEINVWVPFTNTIKSQSFKILPLDKSIVLLETYNFKLEDLKNAISNDDSVYSFINENSHYVEMSLGEAMLFDSRCLHGVRKNRSEFSRASMDIRILPVDDFSIRPFKYKGSKGTKRQSHFTPGDYYFNDPVRINHL